MSGLCKECGCDAEGLVDSLDEMDTQLGKAQAEIERLISHLEDIRADAESDYRKDGNRIAELEEALEKSLTDCQDCMAEQDQQIAELEAEIERLRDDIKTQNKMLNEQVAIMADLNGEAKELEAQRQEDADLIAAQKREIEVLHGIRDEAERLREEV